MSLAQRVNAKDLKVDATDLAFFASSCVTDDHKSGYLVKQGQYNTFSHKRRFFVLHGNCLFYYKSEDIGSVIGMMWLESCTVEESPEVLEGLYGFTIRTLSGREIKLSAETVEERSEWVVAFRNCSVDKVTRDIRIVQDQVDQLRASNSRSKSDLAQAQNAREVLQRELDALLKAHDELKQQIQELSERPTPAAAPAPAPAAAANEGTLVVASGSDLEERVRALEMDRDILLRCRGILPRTLPVWANDALSGKAGAAARIWVGSWNMGANEPFVGMDRGRAPKLLRNFVPSGYDIYLLGVQEGASESPLEAVESLLGMEGCVRLRLDTHGSKGVESIRQSDRPGAAANGVESMDKLFGRGDGSLLSPKYTGIAVYVNERIINDVKVLGCTHRAFSPIHSKGGVAVALSIRGRTLAFVTCHLEAHKNEQRRQQYRELCQALGSQLGEGDFHLAQQFHHVIWCGDLNYRCVDINGEHFSAEAACHMLEQGDNRLLFDVHDQLNQERAAQQVFAGFHEPQPFPDFFPTYKKYENRRQLDYSDPSWVRQCYRIRYKEPFYKGGKVKERTPGYCDRVLYHSLPDMLEHLVPEAVTADLLATSISEAALENGALLNPTLHNYRSVNDGEGMSISDHSPVFATFLLKLDGTTDAASDVPVDEAASTASSAPGTAAGAPISAAGSEEQPTTESETGAAGDVAVDVVPFTPLARTLSGETIFRLKNFRLIWGSSSSLPGTLKVVFPGPFEVDHAHRFVAVSAEPNGGAAQDVSDTASEPNVLGVWHRVEGTTGSCVGVQIALTDTMTEVPALTLAWRNPTVPLDNLHVLVKASLPSNPSLRQEKKEAISAGECSIGLRRLCRVADTHEVLSVSQPLEREGLPMFNLETKTNSKLEVSLSCDLEVVSH